MAHQPLTHAEKMILRKKLMEFRQIAHMLAVGQISQIVNPIGFAHHATMLVDLVERGMGFDDPESYYHIAEQGE